MTSGLLPLILADTPEHNGARNAPMSIPDRWATLGKGHIVGHGLTPDQVEEVYYSEGPFPTLVIKHKKKHIKSGDYRYSLWGTDASGTCIKVIV